MTESGLYPVRSASVRSTRLGNSTFLAKGSETFKLGDIEAHIWRLSNGSKNLAEIAASVEAGYAVDLETATQDLTEFLQELADAQLLSWHPKPS